MNLPNQIAEPPELATSHYWESRATTAEEKVKDWSVRAVECEQRVRELEELLAESVPKITYDAIIEVSCGQQQRIAKAREILKTVHPEGVQQYAQAYTHDVIQRVLEALEGK